MPSVAETNGGTTEASTAGRTSSGAGRSRCGSMTALNAILHFKRLSDPDHPLREAGKDGVELYVGTLADGKKKLLFTLRQVEYVAEYIFQLRLTDPVWLAYLAALKAAPAPGSNEAPPPMNPQIQRIPLPAVFLPKDLFVSIEPVLMTKANAKTLDKKLKKYNNNLKRQKASGSRSGSDSESLDPSPPSSALSSPETPQLELFEPNVDANDSEGLQRAFTQALAAVDESATAPDPAAYFDLAQQAVFVASHGGIFRTLNKKNPPGWNTSNIENYLTPAVGRSLFLSLETRAREDDPLQVVDVGYAAVWYAPDPADPEKFVVAQECGHWVAQEERAGGNPATTSPFAFGSSIPYPRGSILSKLNRKILELWMKAGRGPIYIVMHSVDNDYTKFGDLGLAVAEWHKSLDPVGWAYPGHSTPEALGQRILLDTALLWGAVEKDQPNDKTEVGVTTRPIKDILELLNPGQFTEIDDKNNSGNKAMMTFILFDTLLNNSSLKDTRDWAYYALLREMLDETTSTAASTGTGATDTTAVNSEAATTVLQNPVPTPGSDEDEDDSDDEFAGIQACYVNEKGELVAYGADSDDDD